ncbi:efflux RND transporter periplasmic adaptor subunit [Pedobacter sp. MC2016-15]|uniref:efflux RND transporter periplasmic adaptor subunit n=1 Tax=Pedobacter sp. MC2016-15 TaxID=2994473 RepID=UPI0022471BCF|nr:efflux RND transporter periplasmic adaptor subunit [Pedobacter sp. MC2016-15]MCX2481771.1 efflux RND transporter periplasmic adaptor subunit [Pedobacter sp. MC2016-15]
MKPKKIILIIISIVVILGLIWFFFMRNKEQPAMVTTEKPETGAISTSVTATGTIQPVDTVTVGTQVSGTLSAMYADFNSTVKKGQLLAELDPILLQATVDQAKASLAQAQSNEIYQQANFKRQELLFKTDAISKAEYDLAKNTFQVAKANVNNTRAQLRSAERNLSFTKIYSPIDGVVLGRSVSIGQTVAASFSTPTLFTIAKDITKMQVEAKVDEADIGNVLKGQRSTFTVDAFIDDTFNGTVKEIRLQPVISSNVVTYTTIIDAPNDDKKLKPGMTASIVIYTKEIKDALLISAQALKFRPDSTLGKEYEIVPIKGMGDKKSNMKTGARSGAGAKQTVTAASGEKKEIVKDEPSFVWLVQGKKLVQKRIKTGLNDNTHVQVLEGLTADDVIASGSEQVAKGAPAGAASSPFMPKRPGGGRR